MLGAMLDLKIRQGSSNQRSLDDVMRGMYRKFYQQKQRGFTDAEFREECETAAGESLSDVFAYASTSKEVDYAPYFALAGLRLDAITEDAVGGFIGLDTHSEEVPASEAGGGRGGGPQFRLVVTDAAGGSPAAQSGLQAGDRLMQVDGIAATAAVLNNAVKSKAGGEKIRLHILSPGVEKDVEVTVARNVKKTFRLSEPAQATAAQKAMLNAWLRRAI